MPPAYNPSEVPATGTTATRFALHVSPGGFNASIPEVVVTCLNALTEDRVREAARRMPEQKTIALKRVRISDDGAYVLVERRAITGHITCEPVRPGRFVKKTMQAGELLDSFFLGETAYQDYPDALVFDALRDVAEQIGATGRQLRILNDECARLIALRGGVLVTTSDLP